MKPLRLSAVAFLLALVLPASAQVTFSFNFTDAAGVGFNEVGLSATRQAALQAAGTTLASYFTGYSARTVSFNVSTDNGGLFLAAASSNVSGITTGGFYQTDAQKNIQNGTVGGTNTILWNFSYSWDYGDTIGSGAFDFKSVAMHEILHTLGFMSFLNGSGQGGALQTSGSPDVWSIYDQFLTNSTGTALVDGSGQFNTGLSGLLSDGSGSDVYFSGPNAKAANGGQSVHLYSPITYLAGSSFSHLDTDFYGSNNYIMTHAVSTGPSVRTLSAIELGILTDLGYSVGVTPVPEPATCAAALGALALAFAVRRRRATAA